MLTSIQPINSISDYIESFIAYCDVERYLSNASIEHHKRCLSRFNEFLKNKGIEDVSIINKDLIRRFLGNIPKENRTEHVLYGYLSSLRQFGKFLQREGVKNSFIDLELPQLSKKIIQVLTKEEIIKLIECARNKNNVRDWALLECLYSTGARANELLSLKNKDINIKARTIKVFGKGSKERICMLNKMALMSMLAYQMTKKKEDLSPENLFFLNTKGEKLDKGTLGEVIKRYASFAGISKRVYPHLFRHSFATHILEGGANIMEVKELLGHESVVTTQIYTHISRKKLIEDFKKFHPQEGEKARIEQLEHKIKELEMKLGVKIEHKEEVDIHSKSMQEIIKEAEEKAKEWLTLEETAKIFNRTPITIRSWIKKRFIKKVDRTGFYLRVSRVEVEYLLKNKDIWPKSLIIRGEKALKEKERRYGTKSGRNKALAQKLIEYCGDRILDHTQRKSPKGKFISISHASRDLKVYKKVIEQAMQEDIFIRKMEENERHNSPQRARDIN